MLALRSARVHVVWLAVLAVLCVPGAAGAAPGPLKGDGSGLCADVAGGDTAPATSVITWPCHGGSNQGWELTSAGTLRTFAGTRCLDAYGGNTAPGTPLISYPCHGATNQQWRYDAAARSIVGVASGLCVDVTAGSTAPGAKLELWPCHGGTNQRWSQPSASGSDSVAPTPPGAPKVSALACRSATLTWTASSDAVGVTAYDVYHDGQLMTSVSGTTLTTGVTLTPGAVWGLYVNARDAAGNVSQASPTTSITVPQCSVDTQAPTVPGGLTGTAAGTAVTLRWSASTDDVGVKAYDVYRGDTKVGSTADLTFTDSGLGARTAYRYSVLARDAQGNASARSAAITVTTGASCSTAVCSTTQVGTDTDIPWGLVALPDGTALYSRRDAQDIVRLDLTTGTKTSLGTVPNVQSTDGEGGLLGLAVTSAFPTGDPWLYVFHTSPTDNRIVRIKLVGGKLDTSTEQVLLSGIARNKYHNGGRLRFGPDGKLYASTGDAQNGANAQDLNSLNGKILRLNPDGSKPSDNPFGTYVWSYGHRNPQGLAFDSQGRLWEQEFGNSELDETNLITKGGNYGWPDCEGTISQRGGGCATPGFVAPKRTYPVADGSCSGIAIVRDVLYVACERGTRMYRHVISGTTLTDTTTLFAGTYGRLRTVEPTPDGGLLMTTTNTGDKDSVPDNSDEKILKVVLGS
ncbi:MAG: PQQ-dependent sugar dehydrogenase [Patulibacter sp.]|nr:PQQ-dependent sugar dehydrogenase [Patulibacter sp.]